MTPSHEIHIKAEHIIKLYTDDTGRFSVRSRSGSQYKMIAYHCGPNAIISAPFKYRVNKHRLMAYGAIMQRLKECNMLVDLQILDNKSSTGYKRVIKAKWVVGYQLVPPNIHL